MPLLAQQIGLPNIAHGNSINTKIWLFWNASVAISDITLNPQDITVLAKKDDMEVVVSSVYASTEKNIRRSLWDHLLNISAAKPWMVCGDFNVVTTAAEKLGGNPHNWNAMCEFNDFIDEAKLINSHAEGPNFTWCNDHPVTKIWERLDRFLVNKECFNLLPNLSFHHEPRAISDH